MNENVSDKHSDIGNVSRYRQRAKFPTGVNSADANGFCENDFVIVGDFAINIGLSWCERSVKDKKKRNKQQPSEFFKVNFFSEIEFKTNRKMVSANLSGELKKPLATIGQKVRTALLQARVEKRLIVGLSSAVKLLAKTPEDSVFCVFASSSAGDATRHMLEVLLEAYCYEHGIYILKIDDTQKLSRILGANRVESCALIQRSWAPQSTEDLTPVETALVDYCEELWDEPVKPVIKLPEWCELLESRFGHFYLDFQLLDAVYWKMNLYSANLIF